MLSPPYNSSPGGWPRWSRSAQGHLLLVLELLQTAGALSHEQHVLCCRPSVCGSQDPTMTWPPQKRR